MARHAQASDAGRLRGDGRTRRHGLPAVKRARLRIFIFSEHAIYCDSLRTLLDQNAGLHVVGSAAVWDMAVPAARTCRPDIIVLDLHTPPFPRGDIVSALLAACHSARIIMLAPQVGEREVRDAVRLGVRGVVPKSVAGDVLSKSIRAVAAGQYWFDRETLIRFVQTVGSTGASLSTGSNPHHPFGLTRRELEIVSGMVNGGSNKQIASECGISEKTVKRHLTNIFDKLGLSKRLELAVFALEHRLIARPS